jgi:RimJ/RimL family protein N-acetyltransferase
MDAVAIREATGGDADAIAGLVARNEPDLIVSEISRDERRARFHDGLSSGAIVSLVAEANGQLVGELTIVLNHPAPTEIGFGVHPEWRGRGIANALIERAVHFAAERRIHKLTARVMTHNVAALRVLEQQGFVEEGYLANEFVRKAGEANDAVLLSRPIQSTAVRSPLRA